MSGFCSIFCSQIVSFFWSNVLILKLLSWLLHHCPFLFNWFSFYISFCRPCKVKGGKKKKGQQQPTAGFLLLVKEPKVFLQAVSLFSNHRHLWLMLSLSTVSKPKLESVLPCIVSFWHIICCYVLLKQSYCCPLRNCLHAYVCVYIAHTLNGQVGRIPCISSICYCSLLSSC